jgi:hypothetical protein
MKKFIVLLLGLVLMSGSCEEIKGTFNMTKCKYDYNSISNMTLVGVNPKNMNILDGVILAAAFASSETPLPLVFVLNLDVTNSNKETASLSGGSYVLFIDGIEMFEGVLLPFKVNAGATAIMPIEMAFDLRQALSGNSLESIKKLAFNFAGIGDGSSNVKVLLSPMFIIAGIELPSPTIPIEFTVGGK